MLSAFNASRNLLPPLSCYATFWSPSLSEGGLRYLLANHPIRRPLPTARKKAVCGADGLGGYYGVSYARTRIMREICGRYGGVRGYLVADSLLFLHGDGAVVGYGDGHSILNVVEKFVA